MDKNKTHLIFLIQSFEQPRILKIILDAAKDFDDIFVYGFDRKIHSVGNYKILENLANIKYQIVASFEDGKYINRTLGYLKLLFLLYKRHGLSFKNLYVVGIDNRFLTLFLINKRVNYVISDLLWPYFSQPKKWIFGNLDKLMAKNSEKVSMTSMGFYEGYYDQWVPKERLEITENKLATYGRVHPIENLRKDCISVAYIGAFRYEKIIENLLSVIKTMPQIQLNFYGDGYATIVSTMKSHAAQYPNINFHGAFKNPDDLQSIYQDNNLNFVVYNNLQENERVAMPNKYYESGFFNIPILCATNTYVGKRALELHMGYTCDIDNKSIKDFFETLTIEKLVTTHNHIKTLNKHLFHY